jgi:hypothetical protein
MRKRSCFVDSCRSCLWPTSFFITARLGLGPGKKPLVNLLSWSPFKSVLVWSCEKSHSEIPCSSACLQLRHLWRKIGNMKPRKTPCHWPAHNHPVCTYTDGTDRQQHEQDNSTHAQTIFTDLNAGKITKNNTTEITQQQIHNGFLTNDEHKPFLLITFRRLSEKAKTSLETVARTRVRERWQASEHGNE